ncbi:MAG: hypothetical protein AAGN66_24365 [Acidobacteriota bacterium]
MSQRIPEDKKVRRRRHLSAKAVDKLKAHRGMATWGERLVPLGEFKSAVQSYGRELDEEEREAERRAYLEPRPDPTPV